MAPLCLGPCCGCSVLACLALLGPCCDSHGLSSKPTTHPKKTLASNKGQLVKLVGHCVMTSPLVSEWFVGARATRKTFRLTLTHSLTPLVTTHSHITTTITLGSCCANGQGPLLPAGPIQSATWAHSSRKNRKFNYKQQQQEDNNRLGNRIMLLFRIEETVI